MREHDLGIEAGHGLAIPGEQADRRVGPGQRQPVRLLRVEVE